MDDSLSDMFSSSILFDDFEHLRIIFEDVLCSVSFLDVEETVFKDEVPKLRKACDEVLKNICEFDQNNKNLDEVKASLQKYIKLLDFAHNAVKYINKRIQFLQVKSLPLNFCKLLLITFKHCKDSEAIYGPNCVSVSFLLTELFKKAKDVQNSLLILLNSFIIFDSNDVQQIHVLGQVLEIISSIGKIVVTLDIRSGIELWKGYMLLTQNNNEVLKNLINIESVVNFFCLEIITAMNGIDKNLDFKSTEKLVKISSFNLKIVISLCGLYEELGQSYDNLLNVLILLHKHSFAYLNVEKYDKKLIDLIHNHLVIASDSLLNCIISKREFLQLFYSTIKLKINDQTRLGSILITISIIKKLLNGDKTLYHLWITSDMSYNIITVIFESLEMLHIEFCINLQMSIPGSTGEQAKIVSLYEYILVYTTAILIGVDSKYCKAVQNLLFTSLMQNNLWRGIFSSDLWCIIARYGSSEFCYEQLKFLIHVFLSIQQANDRIEIIFLTNLIHRLYSFLTDKYKTSIATEFPVRNYKKIWTVIELKNEINIKKSVNTFLDDSIKSIEAFCNTRNVEDFVVMSQNLELLSSYNFPEPNDSVRTNLVNKLCNLWCLNISRTQKNSCKLLLLNSLCKITNCTIKYFNNSDIVKVLQNILQIQDTSVKIMSLKCSVLKSLANKYIESSNQNTVFDLIVKLFKNVLHDSNPLIKQSALETFSFFAHYTVYETILANVVDADVKLQEDISNYLQQIVPKGTLSRWDYFKKHQNTIQHQCCVSSVEPALKRPKLMIMSNIDVETIVQRLKTDVGSLSEFTRSASLPTVVQNDLSQIAQDIQKLL